MKKKIFTVAGVLIGVAFVFLLLVLHDRGEKYEIIHATFVSVTNSDMLQQRAALCYSNKDLMEAAERFGVLDQVETKSYNLDEPNLIACIVPNYSVERVVGRQDFGLIIMRKESTSGISFTVFKGTKRFLQFNYETAR